MKVLHIVGSGGFGGIERLVLDIARIQKRDGWEVGILFSEVEEKALGKFTEAGLECFSAGLRNGYDILPSKYFHVRSLCQDCDIVHLHSYNPLFVAAAVRSHRPLIFTMHGNNLGLGRKFGWSDRIKTRLLRRFLNRHVNFVAYNSNFTKTMSESWYGLRDVERLTVYNGVDLASIRKSVGTPGPALSGRIQGKFVVGTSSRFAGFKRIDRLIEGFAVFQQDKPDALLLLVGDGILRQEFERRIGDLGISDKTVFTGYRENVHDFQRVMDVCVFPSENEPFGLAAVETLSLGKPTIIFADGGGLVEIVAGCVPDDIVADINGLVNRLDHYYLNRETISHDSAYRRDYAARYDIHATVLEYSRIYQNLVSSAR